MIPILRPRLQFWGAIAGALIGAAGNYFGGRESSKGQSDANATNLKISREQTAFQERMSNTAVTRAMQDYRNAGLNPMIAGMNPASTPAGSTTRVENAREGIGRGISGAATSAASALNLANVEQQNKLLAAQTDKTKAEAAVMEAQVPYSASNARLSSFKLENEVASLAQDVQSKIRDVALKDIDIEKMRPLVMEYQRLLNQGEKADLTLKQITSDFFEKVPQAKWLQIVREVLGIGRVGPR